MSHRTEGVAVVEPDGAGDQRPARPWWRSPWVPLAVAALVYVLVAVLAGVLHSGVSHDESVYLAKADPSAPDISWAPWRALGMVVLVLPLDLVGPHVMAVRAYACGLSAIGLFFGFLPWLRVLRPLTVALAAGLFGTTWAVVYFGDAVQPNMWVALGGVASVALFVRAVQEPRRLRLHLALFAVLVGTTLMRPSDATWVALPLGVVGLWILVRGRNPRPFATVVAGVVIGWIPWVIEAYMRFGGPIKRYHDASTEGIGGLHPNLFTLRLYLRLLDGPFYAYKDNLGPVGGYRPVYLVWLGIGLALAVVGMWSRRPAGAAYAVRLAAACAVSAAFLYVLLLTYASPRFLLPTAALLSLPVGQGLVTLAGWVGRGRSAVAATTCVVLVGLHLGLQVPTARHLVTSTHPVAQRQARIVSDLQALGLRKPCMVVATDSGSPMAWELHCAYRLLHPYGAPSVAKALRRGEDVVVISNVHSLPAQFDSWTPVTLPGVVAFKAFFPPGRTTSR